MAGLVMTLPYSSGGSGKVIKRFMSVRQRFRPEWRQSAKSGLVDAPVWLWPMNRVIRRAGRPAGFSPLISGLLQ
jgi:hypothetical protein